MKLFRENNFDNRIKLLTRIFLTLKIFKFTICDGIFKCIFLPITA